MFGIGQTSFMSPRDILMISYGNPKVNKGLLIFSKRNWLTKSNLLLTLPFMNTRMTTDGHCETKIRLKWKRHKTKQGQPPEVVFLIYHKFYFNPYLQAGTPSITLHSSLSSQSPLDAIYSSHSSESSWRPARSTANSIDKEFHMHRTDHTDRMKRTD